MRPVEGLGDQRDGSRAAPAEQDRRNRDARGIVPFGSDDRALGGGGGEPGIGVGCGFGRAGSPVASLPVGQVSRRRIGEALPPHVAVIGERDIGEDAVAAQRRDRVGVRDLAGSGCDAEESRLGIDGVEPAVAAESQPRDIVAEGLDPPAGNGRLEHGKIGLPAGGGKGRRQVFGVAARRRDLNDEHVLCQPPLVAGHHRCHPQRVAFLTEQGVAAIPPHSLQIYGRCRAKGPVNAGLESCAPASSKAFVMCTPESETCLQHICNVSPDERQAASRRMTHEIASSRPVYLSTYRLNYHLTPVSFRVGGCFAGGTCGVQDRVQVP